MLEQPRSCVLPVTLIPAQLRSGALSREVYHPQRTGKKEGTSAGPVSDETRARFRRSSSLRRKGRSGIRRRLVLFS